MLQLIERLRGGDDSPEALCALSYAWGNTSHSLRPSALQRLHRLALTASRPILDLGSGLSTIVAAVAAEKAGVAIFALENDRGHFLKLGRALLDLGLKSVELRHCPLVDGWYSIPRDLPDSFGLVVIDGPMILENRGRAYDLLGDRIKTAHVIADDINFQPIAFPFNRWTLATGRVAERFGSYAVARAE